MSNTNASFNKDAQEVSAALGVVAQACTLICLGAERNTGQARSGGLNDRLYFVNWQRATGSLYSTVVVRVTRNDKVECSIHSRGIFFLRSFWPAATPFSSLNTCEQKSPRKRFRSRGKGHAKKVMSAPRIELRTLSDHTKSVKDT